MYVIDQHGNESPYLAGGMLQPVQTFITVHPMTQQPVLVAMVDNAAPPLSLPYQLQQRLMQEQH